MLARCLTAFALGLLLAAPASAADVTLSTADGVSLAADYLSSPGSTQGVVFVHMEKRKQGDWRFVAERLNKSGFHTLAIDLRGHGANIPEGQPRPKLTDDDYQAMTADVEAAVQYLRNMGVTEVSLVGASVGANLAAQVAARDPKIANLVMLSPGLEVQGVAAAEAVSAYGGRPILIAVSDDDTYAAKTALLLDASVTGPHHLEILTAAGKGTKMLNAAPTLESLIQGWLMGSWKTAASGDGASGIATGDTEQVHTDGIKMDD
jgi:pimeloyl-ACP methyl ester carboxylesterase